MKELFENEDDLDLDDLSSSLADSVSDVIDGEKSEETSDDNEEFVVDMAGVFDDEEEIEDEEKTEEDVQSVKKRKIPKPLKIFLIVFGVILGLGLIAYLVIYIWIDSRYVHNDFSNEERYEEEFEEVEEDEEYDPGTVINPEDISWDNLKGDTVYDEDVINILLVGCDANSTSKDRGRTDSMMILTINKKQKSIKLTSIMRDMYVPIEGYRDNKINAAYRQGGMTLLKSTVEDVFKIGISYQVRINFDTFQVIIDKLGGIEVTLNEKEAKFINEKAVNSSNIGAGDSVKLNGEQALWFSRIRYASSDIYGRDDFGRTKRQRTVLNYIFQEYKDMSYTELVDMVNTLLPYVETDMTTNEIIACAWNALSFRSSGFEEYRIPADKCYEGGYVKLPSGKDMSVILIDKYIKENLDGVHMFIYGNTDY